MNLIIRRFEDTEDNVSVATVDNPCPKCSRENSLIISYRKDKITSGSSHTISYMKICCIACDFKKNGEFKW